MGASSNHNHDDHAQNEAHSGGCCGHDHGHKHEHEVEQIAAAQAAKTGKSNHHNKLLWATIAAAFSHIFCCVLPGIFALLALLSNFGIVATMPGWAEDLHDTMHGTEVPVLIFSGVVVAFGWLAHFYSRGHDCHQVGDCHHESCQPRKKKVSVILLIASLLFAVNLVVYFGFHQPHEDIAEAHAHDH